MTVEINDNEARVLLQMEKHYLDNVGFVFTGLGEALRIPLFSDDHREEFMLDITRSRIEIRKTTLQNRARKAVVLARLDLGGPPHRNPDGEEIPCPHMHLYREGYGDKWAVPLPDDFTNSLDIPHTLNEFMQYCNIITKPDIKWGLFS